MTHLRQRHSTCLIFNPTHPEIDFEDFKYDKRWVDFYGDVKESVLTNTPELHDKHVNLRACVDSDHASKKSTWQPCTGYLVYLNNSLITWFSKRQPTVECSVFGAEFVIMKHVMEDLMGLCFKLWMMSVPLPRPSLVLGDNHSVIFNTSWPESTLKKKSNSICYHVVRDSVAMDEMFTGYIPLKTELSQSFEQGVV